MYICILKVIFNTKDAKDTLQSFSMPFYCMREVELEQPVFGANYIKGKVKCEPGGNFDDYLIESTGGGYFGFTPVCVAATSVTHSLSLLYRLQF